MKRKIKVLLLLMSVCTGLYAQSGVEIGYLNTHLKTTSENQDRKSDPYHGIRIDYTYNYPIIGGLSLKTGLGYLYAYAATKETNANFIVTATLSEQFLSLPVNLKYGYRFSDKFKVSVMAGPNIVFGLSSNFKTSITGDLLGFRVNGDYTYHFYNGKFTSTNLTDEMIDYLNDSADDEMPTYSRFDLQLGTGLEFEFLKKFTLSARYDWGLTNRIKGDFAEGYSIKRDQFSISVGFLF